MSRFSRYSLIVAVTALFLYASTGRDGGYPPALDLMNAPRMMIVYGDVILPRWIAWGVPAFALVAIALQLETSFRWRLAVLGKFTYSIYLLHVFAIGATMAVANRLHLNLIFLPLLAIAIISLALMSYLVIEQPMISLGKRISKKIQVHQASS